MNKLRLREDKQPDPVLCVQCGQAPVWFPAPNPQGRAQSMLSNTVKGHKQRGVEKREVGVRRERILPGVRKKPAEFLSKS